jgi:hypothetical protein
MYGSIPAERLKSRLYRNVGSQGWSRVAGCETPYTVTGGILRTGSKEAPKSRYAQIGLSERGKLPSRRGLIPIEAVVGKSNLRITDIYGSESSATVPLKLWKHNGGIGTSHLLQ